MRTPILNLRISSDEALTRDTMRVAQGHIAAGNAPETARRLYARAVAYQASGALVDARRVAVESLEYSIGVRDPRVALVRRAELDPSARAALAQLAHDATW